MPILYFFYFVNVFFFKTFFSTSNLIDINSFIFSWLLFFPIPFIDFNTTTNLNIFPFLLFGKPLNFIFIYYRVLRRKLYHLRKFVFISISEGLLSYTSYSSQEFSNAFITSFFLLGVSKIFYYFIFSIHLNSSYNILLLFVYFLISLKFNLNFYFRFFSYKLIWLSLGDYFFGLYHTPWKYAYEEVVAGNVFYSELQNENGTIRYWPRFKWYNKINMEIAISLLYIRLWMLAEPFLFSIIKFFLTMFLITNKYLILTYLIGTIIIGSHFLLLFQFGDMQTMYESLIEEEKLLSPNETIKPTYINAMVMLFYITRYIHVDRKERACFFIIKNKDPMNNFTKKMSKYNKFFSKFNTGIDVYWKMCNFYPRESLESNFKLKKSKKNAYFISFSMIMLVIGLIMIFYYSYIIAEDMFS